MTFGWASDDAQRRAASLEILQRRFRREEVKTRYYTPEIHLASFAMPQYVLDLIRTRCL